MTREEVIQLAREANISVFEDNTFADDMYISVLYRFANLVEERTLTNQKSRYYQEGYDAGYYDGSHDERDACAKICDGWTHADGDQCAEAIRARGNDD